MTPAKLVHSATSLWNVRQDLPREPAPILHVTADERRETECSADDGVSTKTSSNCSTSTGNVRAPSVATVGVGHADHDEQIRTSAFVDADVNLVGRVELFRDGVVVLAGCGLSVSLATLFSFTSKVVV
jgi:hypothetical protein